VIVCRGVIRFVLNDYFLFGFFLPLFVFLGRENNFFLGIILFFFGIVLGMFPLIFFGLVLGKIFLGDMSVGANINLPLMIIRP